MQIHLDKDLKVLDFSTEKISLACGNTFFTADYPSKYLSEIVQILLSKGKSESALIEHWGTKNKQSLPELFHLLEQFRQKALLAYSLYHRKALFCTLRTHRDCNFRLPNQFKLMKIIEESPSLQISRFAYIHNRNGVMVIETPLAPVMVELKHPDAIAIFFKISNQMTIKQLKEAFPQIPFSTIKNFLSLLLGASLMEKEEDPVLQTWEFHDLLFHSRSRRGRHGETTATKYRFLGKIPPLPPLKPIPEATEWIALHNPDLELRKQTEASFLEILETRRSIREQGERPISIDQLSEFLYRSARVKQRRPAENYEATQRPYPGGGACYELEIYPLVYHCEGLVQGLYYYHPEKHSLTCLTKWDSSLEVILKAASASTNKKDLSQILLLISCRFGRVTWKYQSMSYATILKDTGILMQNMYLVATAMGLAPCAVGTGNADHFAKVARTNYYEETTVGELILGTRKT